MLVIPGAAKHHVIAADGLAVGLIAVEDVAGETADGQGAVFEKRLVGAETVIAPRAVDALNVGRAC